MPKTLTGKSYSFLSLVLFTTVIGGADGSFEFEAPSGKAPINPILPGAIHSGRASNILMLLVILSNVAMTY